MDTKLPWRINLAIYDHLSELENLSIALIITTRKNPNEAVKTSWKSIANLLLPSSMLLTNFETVIINRNNRKPNIPCLKILILSKSDNILRIYSPFFIYIIQFSSFFKTVSKYF